LFQYSVGDSKVVATDGTTPSGMVTIDSSNVVVTNVDADMPAHIPHPVYLDGYVFVAKVGTADIYNSTLDNPLAWTAGDFITAEMEADNLIRIAKINNYIVAFGRNSIEYFWDAAATPSPLQRNDTPIKINTYLAGFSQFGNRLFYIGVNEGGQPDVYVLKDFAIEEVGSPTVSRYLNSNNAVLASWEAGIMSSKGHTFYVINAGTQKSYVLDVDTKLWSSWAWKTDTYFPLTNAIGITNQTNSYTYFTIGSADSTIYKFNDTTYQDNGTTFTCTVTTEASDFGTLNRKTMRRLALIADRPSSNQNISVSWSDDDYQVFSTPRNVNLNQDLPCLYNLGWFRQRCFKLSYTANDNLRLQDMEVEINKGR
jgi:hypothetical protein